VNEKQLSTLYKGGVKVGLTIVAMVVFGFLGIAELYNQNAKKEVSINSLAMNQLSDDGQAYQEMKAEKQNLWAKWSIASTLAFFSIVLGFGYIGWTSVRTYQELNGSVRTKKKKE